MQRRCPRVHYDQAIQHLEWGNQRWRPSSFVQIFISFSSSNKAQGFQIEVQRMLYVPPPLFLIPTPPPPPSSSKGVSRSIVLKTKITETIKFPAKNPPLFLFLNQINAQLMRSMPNIIAKYFKDLFLHLARFCYWMISCLYLGAVVSGGGEGDIVLLG